MYRAVEQHNCTKEINVNASDLTVTDLNSLHAHGNDIPLYATDGFSKDACYFLPHLTIYGPYGLQLALLVGAFLEVVFLPLVSKSH